MPSIDEKYERLIREFPLAPLSSLDDFDQAGTMLERLACRFKSLTASEKAYLDVLSLLIEQYEHTLSESETLAKAEQEPMSALMDENWLELKRLSERFHLRAFWLYEMSELLRTS